MTDCDHTFDQSDLWPPNDYPPIYNGGDGLHCGLPTRLEARVPCTKCGDRITVSYTLLMGAGGDDE